MRRLAAIPTHIGTPHPPGTLLAGRVTTPTPTQHGDPAHITLNNTDHGTVQCPWTQTPTPPQPGDHAALAVLDDGTYWLIGTWPS